MTEVADLSPTDASNTAISGQSLDGNIANMSAMDDTLQAILGMLGRWTSGDTIASAGTTDIGAQAESYLTVSGTTTITAFGTVRAGTIRYLRFSGILTLTHGASLILPGAASITTVAGDTAIMVSEGSGNWRCLHYQRAGGSTWENLGSVSVSGLSALTKGSLGAYKTLRLTGRLKPDTDGQQLLLQTSTDGGSSYATTSGDYAVQALRANGATVDGIGNTTSVGMFLGSTSIGNAANEKASFTVVLHDFNQATYCDLEGTAKTVNSSGALFAETLAGIRLSATARDTLRIIAASGNITGEVQFEGIRS